MQLSLLTLALEAIEPSKVELRQLAFTAPRVYGTLCQVRAEGLKRDTRLTYITYCTHPRALDGYF